MSWNTRHVWAVGEVLTAGNHNNNDSDLDYVGRELDYAQIVADVTGITATTEATAVAVVTGNSTSYDGGRVKIEFWCPRVEVSVLGSTNVTFVLLCDATVVGWAAVTPVAGAGAGGSSYHPVKVETFHTPSSGLHTYKAAAFVNANSATVKAGAGGSGALLPAFLSVRNAEQ